MSKYLVEDGWIIAAFLDLTRDNGYLICLHESCEWTEPWDHHKTSRILQDFRGNRVKEHYEANHPEFMAMVELSDMNVEWWRDPWQDDYTNGTHNGSRIATARAYREGRVNSTPKKKRIR